jgi:integrase
MTRKPATSGPRKVQEPRGLRSRQRADGTVRVWWEPRAADRKLGFTVVELDADRMTWSRRQAQALNDQVAAARAGGPGAKAKAVKGRAGGRSVSALIADYRLTPHFKGRLAAKTRDSYGKLLLQIEAKWGVYRVAEFDKATMAAWYRTLFDTRGTRIAQALIRMMSILFAHAEELGWRPDNSNPCMRLKLVTPVVRSRAGTAAELEALLAAADAIGQPGMGLAIRLAVYQGQRQTDIRQAQRSAFSLRDLPTGKRAWVWQFVRQKRGTPATLVIHQAVVPQLRGALADPSAEHLIRDASTGRPYDEFLFNKRWRAIRDWAADPEKGGCGQIGDLQFRDLRRTFGILARAGGASRDDVGDVLGNSAAVNPQLGEVYMPASLETASRAVAAVPMPRRARK